MKISKKKRNYASTQWLRVVAAMRGVKNSTLRKGKQNQRERHVSLVRVGEWKL